MCVCVCVSVCVSECVVVVLGGGGMACTLEKVLGDARTLLERLKEHDHAAEGLIDQSGTLGHRVRSMREVGHALPDKVPRTWFWCIFNCVYL